MNFCSERVLIVVTKMKRKALMLYKDAPKFTFTKNEPAFASILCTIHAQKLKNVSTNAQTSHHSAPIYDGFARIKQPYCNKKNMQ